MKKEPGRTTSHPMLLVIVLCIVLAIVFKPQILRGYQELLDHITKADHVCIMDGD